MYDHGTLAPILALVFWTFFMWLWMYATRIPAMQKAKTNPNTATKADMAGLPSSATRIADNYNHLHEQPTVFYAVALVAQLAGPVDSVSIGLAWTYVAIRVLHSFIQATGQVTIRFLVFTIGTIALVWLAVRTAMHMFNLQV